MNKRPEVTERTRENLIAAFWQLYSKKRIEKITVKEITTIAGYNRGTFYEYFTDVYDVLEQIENSLLPDLETIPPVESADFATQIDLFIQMYEKNSQYYVVLLGDNGDPSFQSKIKNRIKPLLMQSLIEKSPLDEEELDYTLEFILSAMLGISSYWYRQEKPMSIEKLIPLMNGLCREGILKKLSV